jgi:hypothetical protein
MFMPALVQVFEIEAETDQMAQRFDAETCGAQGAAAVTLASRLDQAPQHVERAGPDAIAKQELLAARDFVDGGDEPAEADIHRFQRRPRLAANGPALERGHGRKPEERRRNHADARSSWPAHPAACGRAVISPPISLCEIGGTHSRKRWRCR